VFGAIGVAGRVVDDPTVVPGAELSATRGPLQGAHVKRIANIQAAAMAAITPPLLFRHAAIQIVVTHVSLLSRCPSNKLRQIGNVPVAALRYRARHSRLGTIYFWCLLAFSAPATVAYALGRELSLVHSRSDVVRCAWLALSAHRNW
jgi:hypothetical protein